MFNCMNCGQELPDDALFCYKCGNKIQKIQYCDSCGKELPDGALFCMYCGKQVGVSEIKLSTDLEDSAVSENEDWSLDDLIIPDADNQLPDDSELSDEEWAEISKSCISLEDMVNSKNEMVIEDEKESILVEILRLRLKDVITKELCRLTGFSPDNYEVVDEHIQTYKNIVSMHWSSYEAFSSYLEEKCSNFGFKDFEINKISYDFRSSHNDKENSSKWFSWLSNYSLFDLSEKIGMSEPILFNAMKKSFLNKTVANGTDRLIPGEAASDEVKELMAQACDCRYHDSRDLLFYLDILTMRDENYPEETSTIISELSDMDDETSKVISGNYNDIVKRKTPNSFTRIMPQYGMKDLTFKSQLAKACYLYEDFIYFHDDKGAIFRKNLTSGEVLLLAKTLEENYNCPDALDQNSTFPRFCIYNEKIYFPKGCHIFVMDLDGKNINPLLGFEKDRQDIYDGVWAFQGGVLVLSGLDLKLFRYGVDNKPLKLCYGTDVWDFSKNEIITNDGMVIDLNTKEKSNLKKIYPGTAGKHVVMVDGVNEIAYHYEKNGKSLLDGKLIGTDKSGDIVDIWSIPKISRMQYELLEEFNTYSSLVFNGSRMMGKFVSLSLDKSAYSKNDPEGCGQYLAEYSRNGFENKLYSETECICEEHKFGEFHYVLGGNNLVLMGQGLNEYGGTVYASSLITPDGNITPFCRYI